MTEGRPAPLIARFTLPLLLGNMLQQTYALVDASIVGQFLGINALASVGASSSVIFLILGFCNGCCGGFAIPVAQRFGARDHTAMRAYVRASLRVTAAMSALMAAATACCAQSILRLMQTPEAILRDARLYLLITFLGIPCTFFYNLLASIMRALGDSKTPFWFLLFSTALNIALDVFCILVLGWGVAGAAIATVFSQGLSAVLCLAYMRRSFPMLRPVPGEAPPSPRMARRRQLVGVPMGLQYSITALGSNMLQSSNNALGTAYVAAFTAAIRIKMFLICPFESLGIAMATYCGQNHGARRPRRVWQGIRAGIWMMLAYALATIALLAFGAESFATLFVSPDESEILRDAALYLHAGSAFFPVLGLLCILRYAIQGVGRTSLAMFSGVAEMLARAAVSLLAVPAFGYVAVCFGDPSAWVAADLFLVPAFAFVYRRLKLPDSPRPTP